MNLVNDCLDTTWRFWAVQDLYCQKPVVPLPANTPFAETNIPLEPPYVPVSPCFLCWFVLEFILYSQFSIPIIHNSHDSDSHSFHVISYPISHCSIGIPSWLKQVWVWLSLSFISLMWFWIHCCVIRNKKCLPSFTSNLRLFWMLNFWKYSHLLLGMLQSRVYSCYTCASYSIDNEVCCTTTRLAHCRAWPCRQWYAT